MATISGRELRNENTCFMENPLLSATAAMTLNIFYGVAAVALATRMFKDYGWTLFMGLPFFMGVSTVLVHGLRGRRPAWQFLVLGLITSFLLLAGVLVVGLEGLGCLIMAIPLWAATVGLGILTGYAIHMVMWPAGRVRGFPLALLILMVLVPGLMGAESLAPSEPAMTQVTTVVEIDAPADIVWKNVIAFPPLKKPDDWVFKLGAAYPVRAEIVGTGVGAVRQCVFSTGAFVEPITRWDEGKILAFDVAENPPTMEEWSPYRNLHPPHLNGYFISRHGQFELTALPNGHTRLAGTTWYQNHMEPAAYWQRWSDAIVHHIHRNVLEHIKHLAENEAQSRKQTATAHD